MKLMIAFAMSLMSLSIPALADDAKTAAKQHVATARALHAQHKLPEALAELEAAYTLDPQPSLLFALGQIHVQLGRCERARAFYRRFLATRPKRADAEVANEAIAGCKTAPIAKPAIAPVVAPSESIVVPRPPAARPQELTMPLRTTTRSHRSARAAGVSLVAGGVLASIGSLLVYRSAIEARDRADEATTYEAYELLSDRASTRSTTAGILGVVGVAAIATGAIVFTIHRRDSVELQPTAGGAALSWSTPF
jgi:tetratricopeptide (TPR) repeat protein